MVIHPILPFLREAMQGAADPGRALKMQQYMKTTQPFYGIQATERRKIFRRAYKAHPIESKVDYESVIRNLWEGEYREEMYQALEVAERCTMFRDEHSWQLYEWLVHTAPHWDTLDWVAGKIVSPFLLHHQEYEDRLIVWRTDNKFWVRRASLLAHLKHREETNTTLLAETILILADEEEFFIRKAIGWVLRNYSYVDSDWVSSFVREHEDELSGLSRQEALKHIRRMEQRNG